MLSACRNVSILGSAGNAKRAQLAYSAGFGAERSDNGKDAKKGIARDAGMYASNRRDRRKRHPERRPWRPTTTPGQLKTTLDASLLGNPPRLAFVSGLALGGATTFLRCLAGELVRRRVPVVILNPERENDCVAGFRAAGVKVTCHDDRRVIFEDRVTAILRALAEFQPTAVVGCLGQASYEVLRYAPAGVRRVAMIQADHPMFYDTLSPYAENLDDIVGVSRLITTRLEGIEAFRHAAKHYLPYGVAMPSGFQPRVVHNRPLRVLYFGRLINGQKRVYLFPTILAGLTTAGIPFQWTIAGEGDQRAQLERVMRSPTPEQEVTIVEAVPYDKVPALLQAHDVFLLASDAEGLPLSLLEAMGHGLVPVITDLESGVREVVDAGNGMLVAVDDAEGYARAIVHLHHHRSALAAKSAAAHARVEAEFSVAAMTDRWLRVLSPTAIQPATWPTNQRVHPPKALARHPFFWPAWRPLRRLLKAAAPSKA
jgi:glycosyltransferase involved in cell wall biosynthesis